MRLRPLYHICVVDYFLRRAFLVLALAAFNSTVAYAETTPTNNFFHAASAEFGVPEEILQAVAFAQTRGVEPPTESDGDLPHVPRFGIMGLREPQVIVAATRLHVLPDRVKEDRSVNIRAAAALLREYAGSDAGSAPENWAGALAQLSGIDDPEIADVFVFAALSAIDRGIVEPNITVSRRRIDFTSVFPDDRLTLLRAQRFVLDTQSGKLTTDAVARATAVPFIAASGCNFESSRSAPITHIAIHIAEMNFSDLINYFKNCNQPQVSAHYCVSNDGQVVQMVHDADTANHVKYNNEYTIGIEHSGFAENAAWYTHDLYNASASLVRDISARHSIDVNSVYDGSLGAAALIPRDAQFKIKGHRNYAPNETRKTCPGDPWNWRLYRALVRNPDDVAFDDAVNAARNDQRFGNALTGYAMLYQNWSPGWELRSVPFAFQRFFGTQAVTMFHAAYVRDRIQRFVIFWDPDLGNWSGWKPVD